jgi:hypothetical protein
MAHGAYACFASRVSTVACGIPAEAAAATRVTVKPRDSINAESATVSAPSSQQQRHVKSRSHSQHSAVSACASSFKTVIVGSQARRPAQRNLSLYDIVQPAPPLTVLAERSLESGEAEKQETLHRALRACTLENENSCAGATLSQTRFVLQAAPLQHQ